MKKMSNEELEKEIEQVDKDLEHNMEKLLETIRNESKLTIVDRILFSIVLFCAFFFIGTIFYQIINYFITR